MANKLYPYSFSSRQALYVMVSGPYSLEMTEGLQLSSWIGISGSMAEVKKTSMGPDSLTGGFEAISGELRTAKIEISNTEGLGWVNLSVGGALREAYVQLAGPQESLTGWLDPSITGVFKLASTSMSMIEHSLISDLPSITGEFFISAKFGIVEDFAMSSFSVSGNLRPGYLDIADSTDFQSGLQGLDGVFARKQLPLAEELAALSLSNVQLTGQMRSPVIDVSSTEPLTLTGASVSGQMAVKVHQIQETPGLGVSGLTLDGSLRSIVTYTTSEEAFAAILTEVSGSLQEMLRKIDATEMLVASVIGVTGALDSKQKTMDLSESLVSSVSVSGVFRENIVFTEASESIRLSSASVSGVFSLDPGLRVVLFDTLKTEPGPTTLVVSFTNLKD